MQRLTYTKFRDDEQENANGGNDAEHTVTTLTKTRDRKKTGASFQGDEIQIQLYKKRMPPTC